jgi:hypothetical protein
MNSDKITKIELIFNFTKKIVKEVIEFFYDNRGKIKILGLPIASFIAYKIINKNLNQKKNLENFY